MELFRQCLVLVIMSSCFAHGGLVTEKPEDMLGHKEGVFHMKHIENRTIDTPFDRTYWVVAGQLLAGCYPGDRHAQTANQKLSCLIDAGIRHVINLMEPDELHHRSFRFEPYEDRMGDLAQQRKISITLDQVSVKDLSVPTERYMIRILNQIDLCIRYDKPVYLHCWRGRGRTGTVVGCYLARHGLALGKEAIVKIADLREHTADSDRPSPETENQVRMVVDWAEGK
ncbi:MAG: dual specificity protein phosphatase family protein [Desulfatitalea sp.]|nr:dual specificity protein phosphatase family protein [Desulfatitalea sp.]